jgi:hypothetical protein
MKVSHLAETIAMIGFVLCGVLASFSDKTVGAILMAIGIGSIAWWLVWGQNMKGWIGPDFDELVEAEKKLRALTNEWQYPDGSVVPTKERMKVLKRQENIWRQMAEHPCNPNNKRK